MDGFDYPASFKAGRPGRKTLEAPGFFGPQISASKSWQILERPRFVLLGHQQLY